MKKNGQVNLEVNITGFHFAKWPEIKIIHNNKIVLNQTVIEQQSFELVLDNCENLNTIQVIHFNKSFGDLGVWHSNGKDECWAQINDIKFDGVSAGSRFINELEFVTDWTPNQLTMHDQDFLEKYSKFDSDGKMTFNGEISFNFELPIYNWLILKKYKTPIKKTSYFSNATKLWHYEEELVIIEEIKKIMNFE
jgi:hypothetical protein